MGRDYKTSTAHLNDSKRLKDFFKQILQIIADFNLDNNLRISA